MRRIAKQHFAFAQGFRDQSEFVVFEIAQAAMHQLGAGGRCMRSQIVLLDK